MKVKRIKVENFKAVDEEEMELNGCSAIITAGNNQGKTSILSGLIDRLHSEKPDMIVKEGEEKGQNVMELTDGSVIEWNFTEKSERLEYTTADGETMKSGVIGALGEKYFGKQFDIDAFLNAAPKKQVKQLQEIVGVDFEGVNKRYQEAYDNRTEKNRELKRLESADVEKPEKVEKPNIEETKQKLKEARRQNVKRDEKARHKADMEAALNQAVNALEPYNKLNLLLDKKKGLEIIEQVDMPEKADVEALEEELEEKNEKLRKHDAYERDMQSYQEHQENLEEAREEAEAADEKVKEIEQEKKEMIENADMPEGFDIGGGELTYNGFPLSENQISKSGKYIAALKLGAMMVGEVRTLHFDASSLDNNSLEEVQEWAQEQDLQLLIERPDFEGGEITYELISEE